MGTAAIISLILSAAGMVTGGVMNAKANKTEEKALKDRQNKLNAWYDKNYNTNYLDTDEAKSTLQLVRNKLTESQQANSQANAMKGASDEKAVATATEGQKVLADTALNLNAEGTQRKDNIQNAYMAQDFNLAGLKASNLAQKSQNWANLASNAGNLMSTALNEVDTGKQTTTSPLNKTPLVATPPSDQQRKDDLIESITNNATNLLPQNLLSQKKIKPK